MGEDGRPGGTAAPRAEPDMVRIAGGSFRLGSDRHYAEEAPARDVVLDAFRIDRTPVTNDQFGAFIDATGYVTLAERPPDPSLYPGLDPAHLVPGALVFRRTRGPVSLRDPSLWWAFVPGACWRRPEGPGSGLAGRGRHPVVQVAYEDAEAYAAWRGRGLPTEAQWEAAARGGLRGADYAWGDAFTPNGAHMANTWQGDFPWRDLATDSFAGTSPVGSYPPNGYGLFDMAGNVWEWTSDWYAPPGRAEDAASPCCSGGGRRAAPEDSLDPAQRGVRIPRKVIKGGSFLCAPSYCRRYRPAARQPQMIDTGTSHVGFRCAAIC